MSEPTGAHGSWTDERGAPTTSEEGRRRVPGAPQASGRHRDELLDTIREHAETWADAGIRSEEIRALPAETTALLAGLGLFWLKTPAELGGTPLAPLEFCDVIEELAWSRYSCRRR
jgi:alkylation response protein AidB-like acyl-CoA dehydrogenase